MDIGISNMISQNAKKECLEYSSKMMSTNFNLGILKTEGRGLYFSKMSEFQLFDSVVCIITFIRNVRNSKISENFEIFWPQQRRYPEK